MASLGELFSRFLEFSRDERTRGTLRGNFLSELPKVFDYWTLARPEDSRALVAACNQAALLEERQKEFIRWLMDMDEFRDKFWLLPVQLAQCEPFSAWPLLNKFHYPPEDQVVVSGAFVVGDGGILQRVCAVVTPRISVGCGEDVLLVGFEAFDDARMAVNKARDSALQFLGLRGLLILLGYALAGDFIAMATWRATIMWREMRNARKKLADGSLYLWMENTTHVPVEGTSIGLVTFVAIVAGLAKKNLLKSIPSLLPRLSASAFTGEIDGQALRQITDVEKKVGAMDAGGKHFGFLPSANHAPAGHHTITVFRLETVSGVIASLMHLRRMYLFLNLGVLLSLVAGLLVLTVWRNFILPAPSLVGIQSSYGLMTIPSAKEWGLKVHQTDRLTLFVEEDVNNREANVVVSTKLEQGRRPEELKSIEAIEDWQPKIAVHVLDGKAVFDYSRDGEDGPDIIVVQLEQSGRVVTVFPVVLIVR